ncbi:MULTISPECIES: TolC family protein [unclassified Roseofilum]|uniref:TolC family protein n=1 Tax=unclassified Roseofilum TaxID=2620099 RepID=UPI000E9609AF|nr:MULTISPECIES: TolC family protein [unclassified Roseofilum]MBP0009420.1 TolC family protein [Roseofilum sp. Belize Diploria]MBP0031950.1 TolC family protein [Roseofilum sp. Belize BBD 4]HBQ98585.1 transporter [Cyanobacteria bacterium UBA11691]
MPTLRKFIGVSVGAAFAVINPSVNAVVFASDLLLETSQPEPSFEPQTSLEKQQPVSSQPPLEGEVQPTEDEVKGEETPLTPSEPSPASVLSNPEAPSIGDNATWRDRQTVADSQLEETLNLLVDEHSQQLSAEDKAWVSRLQTALSSDPTQNPLPETVVSPHVAQSPELAPLYLDPSPNPLLFPTDPSEVAIEGTQPLTLKQAIDLARRNNIELQQSKLQLERSQAQLRQALAANLPTLTFQSGLQRSQSANSEISARNTDTALGDPDSPTNSLTGTVEVRYDLLTSGLRSANIKAAEKQVQFNALQVEVIEEQIRLNVAEQYYQLQASAEQLRIRQQALVQAERSLRDAQALETAGVGTRFAVLQAQVQVANEQQRLTEAIASLRTARRTLAQILNLPQTLDVSAADPVEIVGRWQLSLNESIILAYKNRAELEQRLIERELNEAQRDARLAGLKPQVSLFANYNALKLWFDDPLLSQGTGDGYTLGAQLNWTLYDGGLSRAQADLEEAEIEIAEQQFADNRNRIRLEVEDAYFQLVSSFDNIQTSIVGLAQAEEALRLARLRFQAGVGTQTDVINSETDLTQAQFNQVQAILGYNLAVARLQRAISNLPASPTL